MVDCHGKNVSVGDTIRLLKLPDIELAESEMSEVKTMLGQQFVIESLEYDCAEITKWFGESDENSQCHSLFLFSSEFELVKKAE